MRKYIQNLRNDCKCLVTVVFAKFQDLVSLLVAAHVEHYESEWVLSDVMMSSVDDVVREMAKQMDKSEVHEALRGMCSLD